jgi:hypothetical protein
MGLVFYDVMWTLNHDDGSNQGRFLLH